MIALKVVAFDGDRSDGKAIKYSFVPVNIDNLFNGIVTYLRLAFLWSSEMPLI